MISEYTLVQFPTLEAMTKFLTSSKVSNIGQVNRQKIMLGSHGIPQVRLYVRVSVRFEKEKLIGICDIPYFSGFLAEAETEKTKELNQQHVNKISKHILQLFPVDQGFFIFNGEYRLEELGS